MQLQELLSFDSSLKQIQKGSLENIESFSHIEAPKENTVCFLKSKKYFERIGLREKKDQYPKTLLVIDDKLWDELDQSFLKSCFDSIFSSSNSQELILKLSKPFYDQKIGSLNMLLDGRQLGTAEIHPTAEIAQNVFIGEKTHIAENVKIYPGSVIGPKVRIASGTIIYPNVTIYPFTDIGMNVRIHSGVVIGSDGYGYEFSGGAHQKIWHVGGVVIADDVEVGSNSNIDMGVMAPTYIGAGTKIDGHVHIGHNCYIGSHCIICGQTGLAGSARLDDYCVLGGRVAVGPDAWLKTGCQVAGAAAINTGSIFEAKTTIGGYPAKNLKDWMKESAYLSLATKRRKK